MERREFIKAMAAVAAMSKVLFADAFVCSRCGNCCRELCQPDMWLGGDLSWQEKQDLLTERKNYPPAEKGCAMLIPDKDKTLCLIWKMFGKDKIDKNCQDYQCKDGKGTLWTDIKTQTVCT